MLRNLTTSLACAIFLTIGFHAAPAFGQTVTVQQTASTDMMAGITDATSSRGQTVLVPAGVTRLLQFTLQTGGDVTPVVRAYDNSTGTIGATLYTAPPLTAPPFPAPAGDITTIIPAPGIAVTPGSHIWIGSTQNAPGMSGQINGSNVDRYPDGVMVDVSGGVSAPRPMWDFYFIAVFGSEAPAAVPTLSEWTMILMGLMFAGGTVLLIHRRRQAP